MFVLVKHNGDLTMEQIIDIAKTMRPRSMARHLSGMYASDLLCSMLSVFHEEKSVVDLLWPLLQEL